jgi:O-antigen ligase
MTSKLTSYLNTEVLLKVCLGLSLVGLFGGKFVPPQFYRYALTVALILLATDAIRNPTGARQAIANPFVWPWLIVLLTLGLSMIQFVNTPELASEHRTVFHVKLLLYSATLIWLIATTIRRERDLNWLFVPMIIALALVLIDFLLRFRMILVTNQLQGWIDARLELALKVAFLILFLPPSIFFFRQTRTRIVVSTLGLITSLLLFALGMRSGWLLVVGLIAIWVAFRPRLARKLSPLVLVGAAALAWLGPNYAMERLHNGFHDLGERPTLVWRPTLTMIADRPWTGFGFGGHYAKTLREYLDRDPDGKNLIRNLKDPHNFYFQMAWHGGAMTVTALIAAMLFLIWRLAPEFRSQVRLENHDAGRALYFLVWSLLILWGGIIANSETPDIFSFSMMFAISAVWFNIHHRTLR